MSLGKGETYSIRGPCKLAIARGSLEVYGRLVGPSQEVIVPVGRSILARVVDRASIESSCEVSPIPQDVYERYKSTAENLLSRGSRIAIVGPSDTGKTTLSAFLVNMALDRDRGSVRYATVDVGQNELYSPGFASSVMVRDIFVPGSTEDDTRCFVGAFSPSRSVERYLYCAKRVSGQSDILIVDTDGWVQPWRGLYSKIALLASIEAEVAALIGLDQKLAETMREHLPDVMLFPVTPLAGGASKSREERRVHRERLVAKRLLQAGTYNIRLGETPIEGAPIMRGNPIAREEARALLGFTPLYAEKFGNEIVIVVKRQQRVSLKGVTILRDGWEKGLIASIPCNGIETLALVEGITYRTMSMRIRGMCYPRKVMLGTDRVRL